MLCTNTIPKVDVRKWLNAVMPKKVWFGLFGFYGISTIVGYLMPNPFFNK